MGTRKRAPDSIAVMVRCEVSVRPLEVVGGRPSGMVNRHGFALDEANEFGAVRGCKLLWPIVPLALDSSGLKTMSSSISPSGGSSPSEGTTVSAVRGS